VPKQSGGVSRTCSVRISSKETVILNLFQDLMNRSSNVEILKLKSEKRTVMSIPLLRRVRGVFLLSEE